MATKAQKPAVKSRDDRKRELLAELKTIEIEEASEAEAKRARLHALWFAHIDSLLACTPDHSYANCSDLHTNSDYDCVRCRLLDVKATGSWWNSEWSLEIAVR